MLAFLLIMLITTNCLYHCDSSSLRFITRPQDVHTYNSFYARFNCEAEGATSYTWLKNWKNTALRRWNATAGTLLYRSLRLPKDNNVTIICQASNGNATIESVAVLYVYPKANATHPIITGEPEDVVASVGTYVSFNCTSFGILGDIRWLLDGKALITSPNSRDISTISNGLYNTSTLTLYSVTAQDKGEYVCQAFGTERVNKGFDSRNATLTIIGAPIIDPHVEINYINEGAPLHLECHVMGIPTPNVTWYDESGNVVNKGSVWELEKVGLELEGGYRCFGINSLGETSTIFRVIIRSKPKIYSARTALKTLPVGSKFELFCNATGQPSLSIFWRKDNILLNDTDHIRIENDTLIIERLNLSDGGIYTCIVQNSVGITSSLVSHLTISNPRPLKPTMLIVNNIMYDRVTLKWSQVTYGDPVFSYDLIVKDFSDENIYPNQSLPLTALTTVDDSFEYILEGLVPYTIYTVLIQAQNNVGKGEFSEFRLFRTSPFIPSPPTIYLRNITTFSVDIDFDVLDQRDLNGPYEGVNFTVSSLQNDFSNTTAIFKSGANLKISYTQYGLLPFHRYTITASSYNGKYYSTRTSEKNFTTSEYSPNSPPTNLHVNCTSPSICTFSWEAPIHANGIITSYTLKLTINDAHLSGFDPVSVTNESYIAKNLKPYSVYSWKIFASTKVGRGPAIIHRFKTSEGVPSSSPKLDVRTINSTAIALTWPSIPASELNGVFHYYQIIYTYVDTSGLDIKKAQITQANNIKLNDLTPYTNYGFTIRVNAGIGYGPSSPIPIYKITTQALPEAVVGNLTATSHSPYSILLQWNPVPEFLIHASTANYKVEIKTGVEWSSIQQVIYTANRYLTSGLLPYTLYTFRVQLFNEIGFAPFSEEVSTTTLQTVPGAPSITGSIGNGDPLLINLSITPTNLTTNVTQYIVMVNSIGNSTIENYSVSPSTHYTTYFSYNATRYINFYQFRVFAKTNIGNGSSAILLIETGGTVPSKSPGGLVALPQSSTSIYLSWNEIPRQFLNGHLIGYQIRYRSISQTEWTYLNITQSDYRHVTNLEIFTTYSFQVAGVTTDSGSYSLSASKRTLPDRPGLVKNVRLLRSEIKLLEIEWDQPDYPNGIISSYRVQVFEVYVNIFTSYLVKQNRITINNLSPYTKYRVLIAATNQILTGKFSSYFDAMTAEDTPSKPYFSHVIRKSRQLTVFWHSPQDPNGIILDYNLSCIRQYSQFTNKTMVKVLHKTDIHTYSATCKGLIPYSKYRIKISARNSFDSNWNSMLTQTDFLPPLLSNITSSPQLVNNDNKHLFTLPKYSEILGNLSFYLVIAIIFDPILTSVDNLTTNYSLTDLHMYSSIFDISQPYPYITANLTPSEYSEFELGDGEIYGGFENVALAKGYGYALYVLACVKSINENAYLVTSSSLSQPIILLRETPHSNSSLAVIASIVASSTAFLCVLICLLLTLISVFCVRVRSKNSKDMNIPYTRCNIEFNTVPWSANLDFKTIPKGSDPITYYRSVINDPHLDARPPVPAYMLPKILENLLENDKQRLSEEYTHLTPIDTSTTNTATNEVNTKKNRYLNILPYDHNRVMLTKPADYINASFIDSADKKNAYIATQGPTEVTLEDFWQMVYDQHIECLVMITKLKENEVEKCIQYWPSDGTNYYGKQEVTLNSTAFYCDYIIRELTLSRIDSKESRIVYQFQFTSWPDHKVPSHAFPMLNFIKRVRQTLQAKHVSTNHPLLVHCSAGVGRTGTFIVLDSMIKRMLNRKEIDVFGQVSYLRTQRMFMVQGKDQYLFIFKVLAEYYTSQKTSIQLSDIENIYSSLSMIIPGTQITSLDSEFLDLEIEYDEENFTVANASINQQKNRQTQLVPLEISRVVLPIQNEQFGSDYINASFIDGYMHKQQFIATQTPFGETISDFWRMIWHYNSNIIVMLHNEPDPCYFPEKLQMHDIYQIEKISERSNPDYIYQQFSMTNLNSGEVRNISHFQHSSTSEGSDCILSAKALLLLCQEIGYTYRSLIPNGIGPITVHCRNGSGTTGMLIAVMNLMEELEESKNINIFQNVYYLRLQRPYMVETVEQYRTVYEAILQQAMTHIDFNASKLKTRGVKTSYSDEITPSTSPVKMSTFAKVGSSISSWSSLQNRLSYTNYRSSQMSATSAFSNPDEVLEIS